MPLGKTLRRRIILRGNASDVETVYEDEVSQGEYEKLVQAGDKPVQQVQDEPSASGRLWDRVSQDWTMPLAQNMRGTSTRGQGAVDSIQVYLGKIVSKCSACTDVGLYQKGTKTHIGQVIKSGKEHEQPGVTLESQFINGEMRKFCTACIYSGRPERASGHIQERIDNGRRHVGATASDIKRFSLQPEPLVTSAVEHEGGIMPRLSKGSIMPSITTNGVAEATQERSVRRGRRRRHRTRKGSGHGS